MKHAKAFFRGLAALLPGLALAFALAIPAWWFGKMVPVIGGAVFALVLGLIVGTFFRPAACVPGIRFTGKKILQYSIILLGFEMHIHNVIAVGSRSLVVMLFTLTAALVTAAVGARLFRVAEKPAILIGVGTCVCGGSAIAATAPVINAGEEDVARSISTIFLFNVIAVFLFPALGRIIGLGDEGFGIWAGTAINDTSSVVAAASAWSEAAGNGTALAIATIVKLTRTLLIIPITLILAIRTARQEGHAGNSFKFSKVFPWFVLGFVAAALANSFLPLPAGMPQALTTAGKFLIVAAMAAIGLSTNLKSLIAGGKGPIALGLACWVAIAVASLLAQSVTGALLT
jgi:uncharacterized integral membrane protein (TIGR00698 family)